jgi:hypothetical protein
VHGSQTFLYTTRYAVAAMGLREGVFSALVAAGLLYLSLFIPPISICASLSATFGIDGILTLVIAGLLYKDEIKAAEFVAGVAIVALVIGIIGTARGMFAC